MNTNAEIQNCPGCGERVTLMPDGLFVALPPRTRAATGGRPMSIEDLMARLREATEGSRELDCWIATHPDTPMAGIVKGLRSVAVCLMPRGIGIMGAGSDDEVQSYLPKTNADWYGVPEYTTSIEAALTLCPPGYWWIIGLGKTRPDEPLAGAALYKPEIIENPDPVAAGEHELAPIAICLACLDYRRIFGEVDRATSEAPIIPGTDVEHR